MKPWEIEDMLTKISYKPAVSLKLISIDGNYLSIGIQARVPDTYNPTNIIKIGGSYHLALYKELDKDIFLSFVRSSLQQFEMHELDEWFKYDGKVINDPHEREFK